MGYEVLKSGFSGFGAKNTALGVYFSADIPSYKEAGVNIYDLKTGKVVCSIPFPESCAVGNVYSCTVTNLSMKGLGYRFFADSKDFPDPYSLEIKNVKSLGPVSVIPSGSEPDGFSEDRRPRIPFSDSVFYLAHVKGLTESDPAVRRGKGTFYGLQSKIPYLKDLGVSSVILMPVYEFNKENNYWGFGDSFYYALNSDYSYSKDAAFEFMNMIKSFHENSMEILLMLAFPENKSTDYICAVSRYYRENFHVDGFRYIGGGIDANAILADPFLKDCKLLFENIELNSVYSKAPARYKNVGILDENFLKNSRRFLKGDDDLVLYMSYAVRENAVFATPVRFITDFRSFTLWDMVSYNRKHNELNGEDNHDGTDYNFSWNCGEEGESVKKKVLNLRYRQVRNAALISYLCQGTPCLLAGDEMLNTSFGNNNPYCQDNKIGWVNYRTDDEALAFYSFIKNLLAFRKRHTVLHQPKPLMLFDYISCKTPDVSFHGEEAWKMDQTPSSREFGIMYSGEYSRQYSGETEDSVFIAYNLHWEDRRFALPFADKDHSWYLLYSTDGTTSEDFDESKAVLLKKKFIKLPGRTIAVLLQKKK